MNYQIKFSVIKSLKHQQCFEIIMFYKRRVFNNGKYYWAIGELDEPEEIIKMLELDSEFYYSKASKYGEVEFNRYLGITTVLFSDKKKARQFIKDYLEPSVLFLELSN